MSASSTFQIANLLEKMTSSDKDYRYMATNDLMSELGKDSIKLDEDSEKKVVKMLLKLLEDKNGEVQNLAVKCLGPLVNKVKDNQVELIVETLVTNMQSADKEQLREVSSLGLKTVIHALPGPSSSALVSNICRTITPRLATAISQTDVQVQLEALDILAELLLRYGSILVVYHVQIQEALLPQLANERPAVRKRTIVAISHLAGTCSQQVFSKTMAFLIDELNSQSKMSTTRTYVNCIASLCRSAGHRFGEWLDSIMPQLIRFCNRDDDELREFCIQAFESFVVRCPREVTPWIKPIMELCEKYVCYDPNYHYDDGDSGMNGGEISGDDFSGSESEQEYSDDEDMSWKVRRASAKCLEAILVTRRELLSDFYLSISPLLISRFKEREENVKADIFGAYVALLKHTKLALPSSRVVSVEGDSEEGRELASRLQAEVPKIVASLTRQMKEKSVKTRQACFALLQQLILVIPGCLAAHLNQLIPGILYSLADKTSSQAMKIETLAFLRSTIACHPSEMFQAHMADLVPAVVTAVADSFYKVTAEALFVIQYLVAAMRPADTCDSMVDFSYQPYVDEVYEPVFTRLKATDIDQEVKERVISCAGQLLASFGDQYPEKVAEVMPLLLDRLRNEITRLTCVRAIHLVVQSPYPVDISRYLPEILAELSTFLRKNQRVLRLATIQLLKALADEKNRYVTVIDDESLNKILTEMPPLLTDADLQIAQMALGFLSRTISVNQTALGNVLDRILDQLSKLILSPLLQGGTLQATLYFLRCLVETGLPTLNFNELVKMLVRPVHDLNTVHKTGYRNTAKAIAVLCAYNRSNSTYVIKDIVAQLKNKTTSDAVLYFSLLSLGELGLLYPESIQDLQPERLVIDAFKSHKEEIQKAASQALGLIAAGNLSRYMPFVLNEIQTQKDRQYLLLIALKEIINAESTDASHVEFIKPYFNNIWQVLLAHAECPEEGTRNVVSECLGKLTLLDPETLLPRLASSLGSRSHLARATTITALKFTIADHPRPIDVYLKEHIGQFLKSLSDPEVLVRRVALVTMNSAAHNKPALIRDLLDDLLPALYTETKVRKDLIREVEMGPFKHTVDDGLDLRKAAFECMYTLLQTCLERLDIFQFLEHVEDGLRDHYDIKMLTYLMLVRLAHLCPTQVLQRIDRLIEPMKQVCTAKPKANSVKQEYEKMDELKRVCIRSFIDLQQIPDAERNPQVVDFMGLVRQNPELWAMHEAVQKDPAKQSMLGGDHAEGMEIS